MPEDKRPVVGDPPTVEEVLAYSRGELSPAEEDRVRELLVQYPEIARAMFASVPEEEAAPGEPGYVSDAELATRFAALEQRLNIATPAPAATALVAEQRVFTPRSMRSRKAIWRYLPVAAAFIILSGLYLQAAMETRRLSSELNRPQVGVDERVLVADARRGGAAEGISLDPAATSYTVVVSSGGDARYEDYRLELIDYATQKSLWKSGLLRRTQDDQMFSIFFKRAFLQPGEYQVFVYGVADGREEHLDTVSFNIPRSGAR